MLTKCLPAFFLTEHWRLDVPSLLPSSFFFCLNYFASSTQRTESILVAHRPLERMTAIYPSWRDSWEWLIDLMFLFLSLEAGFPVVEGRSPRREDLIWRRKINSNLLISCFRLILDERSVNRDGKLMKGCGWFNFAGWLPRKGWGNSNFSSFSDVSMGGSWLNSRLLHYWSKGSFYKSNCVIVRNKWTFHYFLIKIAHLSPGRCGVFNWKQFHF